MSEVLPPTQAPPKSAPTDAPAGMTCPYAVRIADLPTVELLGVKLHAITQAQCVSTIIEELKARRGGCVITPNLDHLRRCRHDPRYARTVQEADLRVADGMPLVWASRLKGTPLPERVAGADLIFSLSSALARHGLSAYLLGGAPQTAEKAAARLSELYPGLPIAGTRCPPMGFEHDADEMCKITQALLAARPTVVFVALGSPKQENLIQRLRSGLPQTWWIGVGVSFSFVCGEVHRAPRWLQRCGFEWVHRLLQEPGRLWKRYLIEDLPFAATLLFGSLRDRISAFSRPRPGLPPADSSAKTITRFPEAGATGRDGQVRSPGGS